MPPQDDSSNPTINQMQAGMGLLPPSMVSMYNARHPGEVAQQFSQQSLFQQQQIISMAAQSRMFPTSTMSPPMMQIGAAPMMPMMPSVPNMLGSMGPAGGQGYTPYPGGGSPWGASPYMQAPPMPVPAYLGQQMPTMPFPFQGRMPSPQFNTPFQAGFARQEQYAEMEGARTVATTGMGARIATDLAFGGIGAAVGRRFGFGAGIGGMAGFGAAEFSGIGGGAQNLWMNTGGAAMSASLGRTAAVMQMSQNFVPGGGSMADSGMGFSRPAAAMTSRMMTDMAGSRGFQADTAGRFNTQDVFRIAGLSADAGLMQGVSDPSGMAQRVRETSKALRMVMELAQEPDVRQAVASMGQLRGMGLNLQQTVDAVSQGRSFARQAGMTFQALSAVGGGMGAQTFQSMGLTQGQGFIQGMSSLAGARASINQGIISPQLAALMGGAQGMAGQNLAFGGQFLQMPMLAPAMMGGAGGLNAGSLRSLMTGGTNVFAMAGQGASNLQSLTGRLGVEGLGQALGMQRMLQDSISASMTPDQMRMAQDRQVMNLARTMGMRGSAGFMSAAQIMGMSGEQAMARVEELGSPQYWDRQRRQANTDRLEVQARNRQRMRSLEPGMLDRMGMDDGVIGDFAHGAQRLGVGLSDFSNNFSRAVNGIGPETWQPSTAAELRSYQSFRRGAGGSAWRSQVANAVSRQGVHEDPLDSTDVYRAMRMEGAGWLTAGGGAASTLITGVPRSVQAGIRASLQRGRESGALMDTMLNTTETQERQAMGDVSARFGGFAGVTRFGSTVAEILRDRGSFGTAFNAAGQMTRGNLSAGAGAALNAAAGAGTMLIPGAAGVAAGFLPGGMVAGTQTNDINARIQQAYIQDRQAHGATRSQIDQEIQQGGVARSIQANASTIALESGGLGEYWARNAATQGANASRGRGTVAAVSERLFRETEGRLTGRTDAAARERFATVSRETSGEVAGIHSSRQDEAHREMMALNYASLGLESRDRNVQERARAEMARITGSLEQRFGTAGALNIRSQAARASRSFRTNGADSAAQLGLAEGMLRRVGAGQTLSGNIGDLERARMGNADTQGFAAGMRMLGQTGGSLITARLHRRPGEDLSNVTQAELEAAVAEMNPNERLQLRRQSPELAAAADRGNIGSFVSDMGAPSVHAEEEFGHKYGETIGGAARSAASGLLGVGFGGMGSFMHGAMTSRGGVTESLTAGAREVGGRLTAGARGISQLFRRVTQHVGTESLGEAQRGAGGMAGYLQRLGEVDRGQADAGAAGLSGASNDLRDAARELHDAVAEMRGQQTGAYINHNLGGGGNG